jgi:hypothetical protein
VRRSSQLYALPPLFNGSLDHYLESRQDLYAFLTQGEPAGQIVGDGFRGWKARYCLGAGAGPFLREIGEVLKGSYRKIQAEGD